MPIVHNAPLTIETTVPVLPPSDKLDDLFSRLIDLHERPQGSGQECLAALDEISGLWAQIDEEADRIASDEGTPLERIPVTLRLAD